MAGSKKEGDRLRVAPAGRFAGPTHVLDLPAELSRLRAEAHGGVDGHRQVTLFHRSPVAQVLFSFSAGGCLKKHSAAGLVTIHVVEGRLVVEADGRNHDLPTGHVLVLDPNVEHDVRAAEPAAMLLTVTLATARAAATPDENPGAARPED